MKRYLIDDVRVGISKGGMTCGPVPGNVIGEIVLRNEDGKASYHCMAEVSGTLNFYESDTSLYQGQIDEDFDNTEFCDLIESSFAKGYDSYYDFYEEDAGKPLYGVLEADKDGSVASFSGDRVWCTEDDQLALIYPAPDPADFTFYDSPLSAEYTISVAGQDGSLATLAKDFHHIYGIASVVSVTETTANAELAEMKSLMTVCKFSFEDKDHPGISLPISTLEIKRGGEAYYVNTYPQQGTVSIAQNVSAWDVYVEPDWKTTGEGGTPLTIDTQGANPTEVYVALFPDLGMTYSFTVTNSDGTYTGTATAVLKEGEFVPATGLKLTKN